MELDEKGMLELDKDLDVMRLIIADEKGTKDADEIIRELNNNKVLNKYFKITNDGQGAIEHIFKGFDVENGLFNGYHSEYLYPNLHYDVSDIGDIDRSRIYSLQIEHKHYNTFFPVQMTYKDIIIAVMLTYKSYCKEHTKRSSYTGYVQEYHMNIHICLTGGEKIYGAYPLI